MRIANIDGRLALAAGTGYIDVEQASGGAFGADPQAVYDVWAEFTNWAARLDTSGHPVIGVTEQTLWGPPVPRPRQVFAIGLNYHDHAAESGLESPVVPPVFTKFPTSLTGHDQPVALPADTVDWEVELVAVIGTRCDYVDAADAWDHIAGMTVGQDLSERGLQLAGPAPQFSLGKSYRGFAPTGPELVTVDELPDPDDLEIGCALDGGEVLQKGRTSDLIFSVPQLVAHLSAVCPLLPGDLIFTGTPSGVGGARKPPKFLRPGDVLTSWIEGVGTLRNTMTAP
ncbi:fumarylacetoacetate hydrolase family protein [Rhodococcus sp. USK10]|uniref:fumarylacetoacetate hydrolase family protein n=1 Tax=Rhodococcus sp. USK10 TaxID=2789739 RepID=UPI001C5ECFCB|nr:fumarylacetoacetate hydrolase family protein [Rhodococcus sp. USK10]QYB07656.1 fumarylacetoacetate hydrolase family protein [Rhodococcus sp. USK10]